MKPSAIQLLILLVIALTAPGPGGAAYAQTADAGAPFGRLPLIDQVDCGSDSDPHERIDNPPGASQVQTILGQPTRVVPPALTSAGMVAYRIGVAKGLVPGRAYLLAVEFPDDGPRSIVILNRGADQQRALATGLSIGDYREQYAYPNPESLAIPHSNQWLTARFFFYLHDRFRPLVGRRNDPDTRRPDGPEAGFWVAIGQFNQKGNPRELGAAVRRIRLFEVPQPETYFLNPRYPPPDLPRRHLYSREEMEDGTAMCLNGGVSDPSDPAFATSCNPATADPVTWLGYKMKVARFLGYNTWGKDLLEFGYNQGWSAAGYGGPQFYWQPATTIWDAALAQASALGLEVMPFFEYAGSLGAESFEADAPDCMTEGSHTECAGEGPWHKCLRKWFGGTYELKCGLQTYGYQRRCRPLGERPNNQYSSVWWSENRCVDVTDPDARTDVARLLDATVLSRRAAATFAGVWFRTRNTHLPISFTDETIARFVAQANAGVAVTRTALRDDLSLRQRYYDWWLGQRRDFLGFIRDHLWRQLPGLTVTFDALPSEHLPVPSNDYSGVVTDDSAGWAAINNDDNWRWRYPPLAWATFVAERRYAASVTSLPMQSAASIAAGEVEHTHSAPGPDPDGYSDVAGVRLAMPFSRLYSVQDAELLARYRSRAGLTLTRYFPLNEDDGTGVLATDQANGSFTAWPMSGMFGYFVTDVDRAGVYSMLAEAHAVAHGDPTAIGYLSSSFHNRAFPEVTRAFAAAFLALPALPSAVLPGAASDPEVVVRAIPTPSHGTYVAIVNTALVAKHDIAVDLPPGSPVFDLVAGVTRTQPLFSLYPGQLVALRIGGDLAGQDDGGPQADGGAADGGAGDGLAGDSDLPGDHNLTGDDPLAGDGAGDQDTSADGMAAHDGAPAGATVAGGCACADTPGTAGIDLASLMIMALLLASARRRRPADRA